MRGDADCFGSPKLLAPCILDPVFSALGLDGLFASVKHASRISYDLQGMVRLLVYGRLLNPASKIATARQNEAYYQPLVSSSNESNVYDALDVIYVNRQRILRRMNTCIARLTGRTAGTLFYDVTNFFFETEQPDGDVTDKDGLVLEKGLRQMGVSKENRKQPLVQMGLFLDENGIPVSIEAFPGNTLDHLTLRSAMKGTVDTLSLGRFILVADRGMYSGTNMCHVVSQGDGYIVSKSLKKSSKAERAWALELDGYVAVGDDFRYKSRIVERTVTGEDGSRKRMKEKVVVYWSRSYYAREERENRSFLAFLEKLQESPHGFRVSASQSRSLRKFIKKEMVHKDTGEVVDSRKLLSMIDEAKLAEFREIMGYYQIVSSELEMDALDIIDKYHGLTRIEDQFREMKGTLETRPVYVNTPEHIRAHLLVCFMALTMLRVIQHKIKQSLPEETGKDLNWSYGLPGNRLSKALREWQIDKLPGEYFRMLNVNAPDLRLILLAFGITVEPTLYTRGLLRALKASVTV
ncbi:MAG: IS1634 family transposase [Acidaminococcaceae bacterium]|nr:IS1634 family transposase [Acidaminococcaceae bacterium]